MPSWRRPSVQRPPRMGYVGCSSWSAKRTCGRRPPISGFPSRLQRPGVFTVYDGRHNPGPRRRQIPGGGAGLRLSRVCRRCESRAWSAGGVHRADPRWGWRAAAPAPDRSDARAGLDSSGTSPEREPSATRWAARRHRHRGLSRFDRSRMSAETKAPLRGFATWRPGRLGRTDRDRTPHHL